MTPTATPMPTLASCDWLRAPSLARLFAAIERDGDTCWVVGGAVRNALLGLRVADVDVATTALPEKVMARAAAAGLKPVPTGIDHGTVTVVVDGHPYEVTTLREDVETHGRHATVAFGRDWAADAHRRDFTMNALYASLDGVVHDFVGGVADCMARRVRFIGDPAARIAEDYLRILRFFRFHAAYGRGGLDPGGLHAAIVARAGLDGLSAERSGQEMLKLVVAVGAPATITQMSDCGILQRVTGRAANLAAFVRLHATSAATGRPMRDAADAPLFLAALSAWTEGDAVGLGARLRLSNRATERMAAAVAWSRRIDPGLDERAVRRLLHAVGAETFGDALLLAHVRGRVGRAVVAPHLDLPERWPVPRLPIGGRDLVRLGVTGGPMVGRLLAAAETAWVSSDFSLPREALLALIAEKIADRND